MFQKLFQVEFLSRQEHAEVGGTSNKSREFLVYGYWTLKYRFIYFILHKSEEKKKAAKKELICNTEKPLKLNKERKVNWCKMQKTSIDFSTVFAAWFANFS